MLLEVELGCRFASGSQRLVAQRFVEATTSYTTGCHEDLQDLAAALLQAAEFHGFNDLVLCRESIRCWADEVASASAPGTGFGVPFTARRWRLHDDDVRDAIREVIPLSREKFLGALVEVWHRVVEEGGDPYLTVFDALVGSRLTREGLWLDREGAAE